MLPGRTSNCRLGGAEPGLVPGVEPEFNVVEDPARDGGALLPFARIELCCAGADTMGAAAAGDTE